MKLSGVERPLPVAEEEGADPVWGEARKSGMAVWRTGGRIGEAALWEDGGQAGRSPVWADAGRVGGSPVWETAGQVGRSPVREIAGEVGRSLVREELGLGGVPARERTGPGDVAEALLAAVEPLWMERRGMPAPELWAAARETGLGARAIYEKVNAPRLRAAGQGGGSLVVRVPAQAPAAGGGSVAAGVREIDRAFQRDARRYDGGLGPL